MVGQWLDKTERARAEQFIQEHGLGGQVVIQGIQAQMGPVYARMDVLLLPTRRDSFPRVVMEAMSNGIPVIATRVDGLPEMVMDGETGFLVESGNIAGFASAVEHLLRDPVQRQRMGGAARERARRLFAPEVYSAAMHRLYAGLPERK